MASKDKSPDELEVIDGDLPEGPDYSSESDLLFRTQMRVADAFYGHWKKGLVILIVFLLSVLFYGLWQGKIEAAQKEASETMAKIDRKMPPVNMLQLQGQWGLDDPSDVRRMKTLEAIAGKYEEVAQDSTGTASIEAWLRAGDTWMRVGNQDSAQAAYTSVLTASDSGLLAVGARNGLAAVALSGKDFPSAIGHYRAIADKEDGSFAQAALISLARAARSSGDSSLAEDALNELEKRYPDTLLAADIAWERQRIATSKDQG